MLRQLVAVPLKAALVDYENLRGRNREGQALYASRSTVQGGYLFRGDDPSSPTSSMMTGGCSCSVNQGQEAENEGPAARQPVGRGLS